jgi:hypothetical protein
MAAVLSARLSGKSLIFDATKNLARKLLLVRKQRPVANGRQEAVTGKRSC